MNKILKNQKLNRIILSLIVILSVFFVPTFLSKILYSIGIHNKNFILIIYMPIYIILISLVYLKELKKEFIIFKKNFKKCLDEGFKYWFLGFFIMIVSNIIINLLIFKGQIAPNEALNRREILSNPIFYTISAVLLGPLLEELIFRKSLDKIFNNVIIYAVVSGFLFGFAHASADLSNPLYLLYIIPYGVLGASFAIMNYKTKTVFTSIAIHSIYNLIVCILLLIVL